MIVQTIRKDPEAKLDYAVDWSDWLSSAEEISSVSWTVASGITQEAQTESETVAIIWLSGGTAGETYEITCHVVSTDLREDDRTFCIVVEDR